MKRIQHRVEPLPNQAIPGYLHVSVAGPFRSTLNLGRNAAKREARARAKRLGPHKC